jgi:hypothetical protein
MCLLTKQFPIERESSDFRKFIKPFDNHGYMFLWKRDTRLPGGSLFFPIHAKPHRGGLQVAKNLNTFPHQAGFYGYLTEYEYRFENPCTPPIRCLIKISWIIDVETLQMGSNGRACRCRKVVFPNKGQSKVTVRKFRDICTRYEKEKTI